MAEKKDGTSGWFDAEYWKHLAQESTTMTPAQAQKLVDAAIRTLGVDPEASKDQEGWRHLSLGSAREEINIVEWKPEQHYLVAWSPVLEIPDDPGLQLLLFEILLRLNQKETGTARFSLGGNQAILSTMRPIQDLNQGEVLDAIKSVLYTSDQVGEKLREKFEIQLPDIPMNEAMHESMLMVLECCEPHSRTIFKHLIEQWHARGGVVKVGENDIGLHAPNSRKSLAALVAIASAGPLIVLSWTSLQKRWGLLPEDFAAFQDAVPRPKRFKAAGTTAHLPVDESFTLEMADQLVEALVLLAEALPRAVPPPPPPLPDLEKRWGLRIKVGGATQRNIDAVLAGSPLPAQAAYTHLIQGWYDAGLPIYTNNARLVYLRIHVDAHTFALCTLRGAHGDKNPRIDLTYPLIYYFEDYPEAREAYEQAIVDIPGFAQRGTKGQITVDAAFGKAETEALLAVLSQLAGAVA